MTSVGVALLGLGALVVLFFTYRTARNVGYDEGYQDGLHDGRNELG